VFEKQQLAREAAELEAEEKAKKEKAANLQGATSN
jgi:PTS system cellobiose-specific IIC component